jgi:hypothetical protein
LQDVARCLAQRLRQLRRRRRDQIEQLPIARERA